MTSTEVQNLRSRNKNAGRRQRSKIATRLDRFFVDADDAVAVVVVVVVSADAVVVVSLVDALAVLMLPANLNETHNQRCCILATKYY